MAFLFSMATLKKALWRAFLVKDSDAAKGLKAQEVNLGARNENGGTYDDGGKNEATDAKDPEILVCDVA